MHPKHTSHNTKRHENEKGASIQHEAAVSKDGTGSKLVKNHREKVTYSITVNVGMRNSSFVCE